MNLSVALSRRIQRKYYPAVLNSNGSIKPGVVLVAGIETLMPGGNFYISWHEGSKCVRKSAGADPTEAIKQMKKKTHELQTLADARDAAEKAGRKLEPTAAAAGEDRQRVDTARAKYLKEIAVHKDHKSYQAYNKALEYFARGCKRVYVSDITRDDMLDFSTFLRKEDLSPRTVYNKFSSVMSFLKWAGYKVDRLHARDWPRFVEEEVEIYEPEDLAPFWPACTPEEHLLFRFLLMTGFREGEAIHAGWKDVSRQRSTVTVKAKPEYRWKPKMDRERSVPIPASLLDELQEAKSKATSPLLFPGDGGSPDGNMLRRVKAIAERAGLDPADFWLHKFRATFCTTHLRQGRDLVTLQKWMGHKNIQSTMRYLRAASGVKVQAEVDATIWA